MKLLVAIPAYNEETAISKVINDVSAAFHDAKILVINDGSSDNTTHVAKSAGAEVIDLPFNLGVGGALRTAFKYASRNSYTHVLQVDADGQHIPREAMKLIEDSKNYEIVIGSRFANKSNAYVVSVTRRLAMHWLAWMLSQICKVKLTDVTSGFRLTSGSAIQLFANRYPTEYLGDTVESLVIAHKHGFRIHEVPVTMLERTHGKPSQNFFKSTWYLFRATLVVVLSLLHRK